MRLGQEVNHSPPSSVKVKNEWSYTLIPLICLHGTNRDTLHEYTSNFETAREKKKNSPLN